MRTLTLILVHVYNHAVCSSASISGLEEGRSCTQLIRLYHTRSLLREETHYYWRKLTLKGGQRLTFRCLDLTLASIRSPHDVNLWPRLRKAICECRLKDEWVCNRRRDPVLCHCLLRLGSIRLVQCKPGRQIESGPAVGSRLPGMYRWKQWMVM